MRKIPMTYRVRLEKFEGPLELLLSLIEEEKMDIAELSLAHVADQYLEYIKSNNNIQLEHMAEFLTVAARLILIKSRTLLPMLKFTEEEEEEIKDLAKQLEEYKKFKEASLSIGKIISRGNISYSREGYFGVKSIFYPPENINVFDLKKYFQGILAEIPIIEKLEEECVREVVTLEERINDLQNTLRQRAESSFAEMTAGAEDKIEVIISFLAMLEMVKQKLVEVEQSELFKEIKLRIKTAK